jgi:hypothetical protein
VVPALFVLYWLFAMPRDCLRWRHVLPWSMFPLGYLVYALLRGALLGSYPYPFIDVARLGYARVLFNALGVAVAFFMLCAPFVIAGQVERQRSA